MEDLIIKVDGEDVTITKDEVNHHKIKAHHMASEYFELFSDPEIKEFVKYMWSKAPDYFFVVPASTSGKYHAKWSTDIGGLVRHVLMGVQVAFDLSHTFGLTDKETDIAMAAMFGHDLLKYGFDFDERYMAMHPFLPRCYFGNYKSEAYVGDFAETEEFDTIMTAIERHMGSLATGEWTSVAGIRPATPIQQVVHLADYIASRKNIVHVDYISGYEY